LRPIDNYFLEKDEPVKNCLQFMRAHILKQDVNITEAWKYGMPFYCYKGKMFCYLWIHKKYQQPYLGLVEGGKIYHPNLLTEQRSRMKILLIDAHLDIQIDTINELLKAAIALYK
jgi:hypothetical protein